MSGSQSKQLRCFNENSPRPPVPGEEREGFVTRFRVNEGPDIPPRRSSLKNQNSSNCNASAPLGFEPEGRCDNSKTMENTDNSSSSLACLQWSRSLHDLLEDPKGLELFEKYLQQEGHVYILSFYFACEGLKEERDPSKLVTITRALFRKFFQRPQLALPDDVRKELRRRFRDGLADKEIFDLAQHEVERLIEDTTYPNFLRSDLYLSHVRRCQSNGGNKHNAKDEDDASFDHKENELKGHRPSSPDDDEEHSLGCSKSNILPTLHEDSEFFSNSGGGNQNTTHSQHNQQNNNHHHHRNNHQHQNLNSQLHNQQQPEYKGEMRLTKDILMATQQLRALDVRPKPEAYAGIYLQPGASPYHATVTRPRTQYSSYNPVSRQDSELQSLSSDARTESDNLSLTDASLDGISVCNRPSKKQYIRQCRAMKKSAMINRDPVGHESIIPRTQRVTKEQTQPLKPEMFARLVIEKLEKVKREQDNQEKFERKLREVDASDENIYEACPPMPVPNIPGGPRSLADALREKLQLEEDSDQDILDQHVSRVWSDLTPSRSPKLASPRPRSPDKRRISQQQANSHHCSQRQSYRRKEKDVFSTFSGDSGNVHDFPEAGDLIGAGSMSSLGSHVHKSKSIPSEYSDSIHKQDHYFQNQDQRFNRLDSSRSATKKSMTELTDSGVSVVSDVAIKDVRLLNWLKESDNKKDSKQSRHLKKYSTQSVNLERAKQPFVDDPGMPLLPQPHTPTQLEEAKRRLILQEEERLRSRQRHLGGSCKQMSCEVVPNMHSSQPSLRKSKQDSGSDFTTVVFSFCEEQVPYRTKIPGHNVTLKQFKEFLPKKGNYRYFFKTECEDLDVKVIQEEITDDLEVLPLWDGKVMAQVKALE